MIYPYIAIGLIAFIVGGALRHLQGGLDAAVGIPRGVVVALYSLLSVTAFLTYGPHPWFGVAYLGTLKATIIAALFFADMLVTQSADFAKPWRVLWRFGAAPVAVAVLTGWSPVLAVGVVLAVATWGLLAAKSVPVCAPWLDGWEAYQEVLIGGVTGAAWTLAPLLGHPFI